MKMLSIATLLCLVVSTQLGYSQNVSSESAPSSTSSTAPSSTNAIQVHTVSVGKVKGYSLPAPWQRINMISTEKQSHQADNQFNPSTIEAAVGDIIRMSGPT